MTEEERRQAYLASVDDVLARLKAALTPPRRMLDAYDIKQELDPWDALEEVRDQLEAALTEVRDHDREFDLYWQAAMRGTRAWRDAHPGSELVAPDTGDLVAWLLDQLEVARRAPCPFCGARRPRARS